MEQTARVAKWASHTTGRLAGVFAWVLITASKPFLRVFRMNRPPPPDAGAAREAAHAAAVGGAEVWLSMERAAYVVLTSARDNVSQVVSHRSARMVVF